MSPWVPHTGARVTKSRAASWRRTSTGTIRRRVVGTRGRTPRGSRGSGRSINQTPTRDVFEIRIDHRILLSATLDDSVTQAMLAANGFANISGIQYFTNGLDTRTRGIDFTGALRTPVGTGTINWSAAVNYTKN